MANDETVKWTVVAYVGPQISSKGDRLVHLYPGDIPGGAKYHCATVYEEAFDLLPFGLGEKLMAADVVAGSAPEMAAAKTQGILQSCPPFMIETWVEGGKKTKRVAKFLGPVAKSIGEGKVAVSIAHEDHTEGLEYHELDEDAVQKQVEQIGLETFWKMQVAIRYFDAIVSELNDDENLMISVFNAMWRDINDQYRYVRPALLVASQASAQSRPDGNQIFIGDRANFLEDVANQHVDIGTEEEAKQICSILGIKGSSEDPATRVVQAQQIWLYATLVNGPFNIDEESAQAWTLSAISLDEVPF